MGDGGSQVAVHDGVHGDLPHAWDGNTRVTNAVPAVVGHTIVQGVGPPRVCGDSVGGRVVLEVLLGQNVERALGVVQERSTETRHLGKRNSREGVDGLAVANDLLCGNGACVYRA